MSLNVYDIYSGDWFPHSDYCSIWVADGGSVVIPAAHWPDPLHLYPPQKILTSPAEQRGQRAALRWWVMAVSAVSRWAGGWGGVNEWAGIRAPLKLTGHHCYRVQ